MTVYVDKAQHSFGRMRLGHMIADRPDELHEMARKLGLKEEWYQWAASWPHYDVSLLKRREALLLGAATLDRRELARKIRELRADPTLWLEDVARMQGKMK